MSKSQSSNVDCRCDGAEMSVRDQRVGTSYSDRVREDVSLEYVMLSQQTYILLNGVDGEPASLSRCVTTKLIFQESDELGGLAEF